MLLLSLFLFSNKRFSNLKNYNKQIIKLKSPFFLIISLLLSNQLVSSQQLDKDSTYTKLYNDIVLNLSTNNPKKALDLSDSLFKNAPSERKKIKALFLSADILVKQNKQAEAIKFALEALSFAKKSKDIHYQARIYGFLSTQCRSIGFYQKGKFYLNQGLSLSYMFSDDKEKLRYQAMANHELGEYSFIADDFKGASEYAKKAIAYYGTLDDSQYRSFVLANARQLYARSYLGLNKNVEALNHFKIASDEIKEAQADNSIYAALISQGTGETFRRLMKSDSAHLYLTKALRFTETVNNSFLKEKVYESLSNYYKGRGQADSAVVYLTKYNQTIRNSRNLNKKSIDVVSNYLDKNRNQESLNNWIWGMGISILLISGGIGVYFYRKKQVTFLTTDVLEPSTSDDKTTTVELSAEMVSKFNQKLEIFEKEKRFLDKTFSYSMLATELETNTKYLNYFLKYHLHTDYHTYINKLRIQFIIHELEMKPHVRKYTLAHLADISGYGSYSAFAVNFKRIMKQSPSKYIQNLK